MKILSLQNLISQNVRIENSQATFVTFNIDGRNFRIDFDDKREFVLKKGMVGQLKYYSEHPLLLDYNENMATTFINSSFDHTDILLTDIKNIIDGVTLGWRNWTNYIEDKNINFTVDTLRNNIKNGSGRFLEAPFSVTIKVIELCDKLNIKTKTFYSNENLKTYRLIMLENNYVIAKNFKLNTQI